MTHSEAKSRAQQDGQDSRQLPGRELKRSEARAATHRANLLMNFGPQQMLCVQKKRNPQGSYSNSTSARWRGRGGFPGLQRPTCSLQARMVSIEARCSKWRQLIRDPTAPSPGSMARAICLGTALFFSRLIAL